MMLSKPAWKRVLGNDIRADLLDLADQADEQAIRSFLADFGISENQIVFLSELKKSGHHCECGEELDSFAIEGEELYYCEECCTTYEKPPP